MASIGNNNAGPGSNSTQGGPSKGGPVSTKPGGPPLGATKRIQVPRPNKVARPDVDDVNRAAEGFLQLYYDCMDGALRNANIVKLYRDVSTIIWNGQTITGAEKIREFLATMPESKHEIQSWDCHPIPGYTPAPILITVSGTVVHGAMPAKMPQTKKPSVLPRVFSQTFVLAPESGGSAAAAAGSTTQGAAGEAAATADAEGPTFFVRSDTMRFVG